MAVDATPGRARGEGDTTVVEWCYKVMDTNETSTCCHMPTFVIPFLKGGTLVKDLGTAYLMWFLSLIIPGLHRFYLGKVGTGLLYFFTYGFGAIGTIIDFFMLPRMVRVANLEYKYKAALMAGDIDFQPRMRRAQPVHRKESVEKTILKAAKTHGGMITPGIVAIDGDITIDKARDALETLAKKGYAEMRIKENGVIIYCFPEFLDETRKAGFESF